jgi:hypothetical protein
MSEIHLLAMTDSRLWSLRIMRTDQKDESLRRHSPKGCRLVQRGAVSRYPGTAHAM